MFNNYGWSSKGARVIFKRVTSSNKSVSLISAISNQKVIYRMIVHGSVNSDIYIQFIKGVNKRVHHKKLLMDNCSIHHSKKVKKHMEGKTNKILYNVAYSPETNPIEQVFKNIKTYVRRKTTDTSNKLIGAINKALNKVTTNDLACYYKHSFG